jgi:flagellar motility protein MotE (MotC chaperone)
MSPAAETKKPSKSDKLGGKEFEETFKPKGRDSTAKQLEEKTDKKNEDKKKKSGFPKIIIFLMIFIVLVAGAGAALYFSGSLSTVFEAVGLKKPTAAVTIEEQQAALEQREAALDEKEQSLDKLQAELDARQQTLEEAESAAAVSADANRTFEEIRSGFSEEKLAELKQVGAIYSKMDAAAAAAIIENIYNEQQIAVIVYNMQPAAAALVMAKLDASLAANVTGILTS